MEDGAIHLEELEVEPLKDDDEATTTVATMPPPSSTSSFEVALALPWPPPPSTTFRGGHVPSSSGRGRSTMQEDTPIAHGSQEKKLEVSHGKKKF